MRCPSSAATCCLILAASHQLRSRQPSNQLLPRQDLPSNDPSEAEPHYRTAVRASRGTSFTCHQYDSEQLHPTARKKTHLLSEIYRHVPILRKPSRMHKILLIIICFLLPPLGVYIHRPACNRDFWINVLLTLLMWLPGEHIVLWGSALRAFHDDNAAACVDEAQLKFSGNAAAMSRTSIILNWRHSNPGELSFGVTHTPFRNMLQGSSMR